jgi:hypothetical protein
MPPANVACSSFAPADEAVETAGIVFVALSSSERVDVREASAHATAVINMAADSHARIRLLRECIGSSSNERADVGHPRARTLYESHGIR